MHRLLISSLSMLLITGSSVLAADEKTTPPAKSSALPIVLPVLAEAQQAAVGSSIGTAAGASVIKPAPAPPTRPFALPALYATAVGLQAFDVYSTLSALHLGGVEQNPLMKNVVETPAALVATKATVTVASIAAAMMSLPWEPLPVLVTCDAAGGTVADRVDESGRGTAAAPPTRRLHCCS